MHLLKRFERGELRLGRIEAFSDGVFAIVVTLLVLELKVPTLHEPTSAAELGRQLIDMAPMLLSWLISFIIVCKFWLNHHSVLSLARHANYAVVWLNAIFLMLQSFIPFPTALMGEYPLNHLAVGLFGVVMALNTLLFIALHAYILHRFIKPEVASDQDPRIIRQSFLGPLGYLIGATAALFNVHAALLAYMLTPLFFIVPPHSRRNVPDPEPVQ